MDRCVIMLVALADSPHVLASVFADVGFGVLFFVGLIVVMIVVPFALSLLPQSVKNWLFDNAVWLFIGFGVLLLMWRNS